MNLDFSEEQMMLKDTVRSFVSKELPEAAVSDLCLKREYPSDLDKKLADLGLFGICFPEVYEGLDLSFIELAIVLEELSRYSIDFGYAYGLNIAGGMTVLRFGTEAQKNDFLPKLIKGEMTFSLGYYEPFVFTDMSKMSYILSLSGEEAEIKGSAGFYSENRSAQNNFILLPLRRDGGIAFAVLPQKIIPKGERLEALGRDMLGIVEYKLGELHLSGDYILGEGRDVLDYITNLMKFVNIMCCIGNMRSVIDETIQYSKEREQFGRPIGTFQALQHMIVDSKARVDVSWLYGYWLSCLLDKDEGNFENISKEINMASVYVTESYMEVVNTGSQVTGGYGYMLENHLERYIRDARMTTYFLEDGFLQKMSVAKKLGIMEG